MCSHKVDSHGYCFHISKYIFWKRNFLFIIWHPFSENDIHRFFSAICISVICNFSHFLVFNRKDNASFSFTVVFLDYQKKHVLSAFPILHKYNLLETYMSCHWNAAKFFIIITPQTLCILHSEPKCEITSVHNMMTPYDSGLVFIQTFISFSF